MRYVDRAGLLVIAAATLWGTTGTAQALGPPNTTPLGVGATRLVIGGAGLIVVAKLRGCLKLPRAAPFGSLALAGIGMAAYQPLFFGAVARTGVALGTVVAIGSAPVFTGLFSFWLDRWRPHTSWLVATASALSGILLISGLPLNADSVGIALAAGAGLAYAVFVVGSKVVLRSMAPMGAMAWGFGLAAALSLPMLFYADVSWVFDARGGAMAAWLGVVATAVAYVAFGHGLRSTEVPNATTLTLAEPLTAGALGVALLGERPGMWGWLGMLLIFFGLTLLSWRGWERSDPG